jgi:hypothetical protein
MTEEKPVEEHEYDPTVRLKPDEIAARLKEANDKLDKINKYTHLLEGHIEYVDYFTDEEKKNLLAEVDFAAANLLNKINNCGVSRELMHADDKVREALFWVNRHMYKE